MTSLLFAASALCLITLSVMAGVTRRPLPVNLALLVGAVWNLWSPLGTPRPEWGISHPVAVLLSAAVGAAAARFFVSFQSDRRLPFVTLSSTSMFIASFMVPYGTVWNATPGVVRSNPNGLTAIGATVYGWLSLILVPGLLVWWTRQLRSGDNAAGSRQALRLLAMAAVAFGTLSSLALAPLEFVLLAPLLGLIGAFPIYALWRFDLSRQDLVVRPLLTDILLLIPLVASAVHHLRWVRVPLNISWGGALIIVMLIVGTGLLALRVVERIAPLWRELQAERLERQASRGLNSQRLAQALLSRRSSRLTREQCWRLSERLKHAYDGRLRQRIGAAAEGISMNGGGHS
jgi:hypothetical protein